MFTSEDLTYWKAYLSLNPPVEKKMDDLMDLMTIMLSRIEQMLGGQGIQLKQNQHVIRYGITEDQLQEQKQEQLSKNLLAIAKK